MGYGEDVLMGVSTKFQAVGKLCHNNLLHPRDDFRALFSSTCNYRICLLSLLYFLLLFPNAIHAQDQNGDRQLTSKEGITQPMPAVELKNTSDRAFLSKKGVTPE